MKSPISILLLTAPVALGAPPEAIQRVTLDERVVIAVPVATNRVTTISFPGPITAIDAVGVTADGKTPGQFQHAHTKGSSFVSVRALSRKAATNLNIRWNKRTLRSSSWLRATRLFSRSTWKSVQRWKRFNRAAAHAHAVAGLVGQGKGVPDP